MLVSSSWFVRGERRCHWFLDHLLLLPSLPRPSSIEKHPRWLRNSKTWRCRRKTIGWSESRLRLLDPPDGYHTFHAIAASDPPTNVSKDLLPSQHVLCVPGRVRCSKPSTEKRRDAMTRPCRRSETVHDTYTKVQVEGGYLPMRSGSIPFPWVGIERDVDGWTGLEGVGTRGVVHSQP